MEYKVLFNGIRIGPENVPVVFDKQAFKTLGLDFGNIEGTHASLLVICVKMSEFVNHGQKVVCNAVRLHNNTFSIIIRKIGSESPRHFDIGLGNIIKVIAD